MYLGFDTWVLIQTVTKQSELVRACLIYLGPYGPLVLRGRLTWPKGLPRPRGQPCPVHKNGRHITKRGKPLAPHHRQNPSLLVPQMAFRGL